MNTRYFERDHLGSIVGFLTDTATVDVQLSFDAWGLRRNVSGSAMTVGSTSWNKIAALTNRGFTGHEHVDKLDLIHMNGRTFDPRIGRFMQADVLVQDPADTQSYNRYSYGNNNPLNGTDLSGYDFGLLELVIWVAVEYVAYKETGTIVIPFGDFAIVVPIGNGGSGGLTGAASGAFGSQAGRGGSSGSSVQHFGSTLGNYNAREARAHSLAVHGYPTSDWYKHLMQEATVSDTDTVVSDGKSANGAVSESWGWVVDIGLEVVPGGELIRCSMGGCSGTDWAWAVLDVTPVGKIAKIRKVERAIERLEELAEPLCTIATAGHVLHMKGTGGCSSGAGKRGTSYHGNDRRNPDPQHNYDIIGSDGRVRKTGVGTGLADDGVSKRAASQLDPGDYYVIRDRHPGGLGARGRAYDREKELAKEHYAAGESMDKHKRPR
jgi:RHS repeat-associated protein